MSLFTSLRLAPLEEMEMSDLPEILDIEQVAELLGISVRTVQRHIAESKGNFPGRQIGSKWVFDKQQVIEWVRGEWRPPRERTSQDDLIEREAKRWGADIWESLIDMQRQAVKRAAEKEKN